MDSLYIDSDLSDDTRRFELYRGQLFTYSPRPAAVALCAFARQLAEEAFAPLDPRTAQHQLPVDAFAAILAKLKPRFIHHPHSKELLRAVLVESGCDVNQTYFDVPKMRTATHGSYLTSGIAYAFHAHRDTWYSAPMCQINWWLPIDDIEPANAMALHPRYWSQPIKNGSSRYNYYRWNEERATAAQHITHDPRYQPRAEEPLDADPQIRVILPAGGLLMFSAAHLHSTVPNTSGHTRFSIDFRTVHIDDVARNIGARNVDSEPVGTALRDFRRASDLAAMPDDLVALHENDPQPHGVLVFHASEASEA